MIFKVQFVLLKLKIVKTLGRKGFIIITILFTLFINFVIVGA